MNNTCYFCGTTLREENIVKRPGVTYFATYCPNPDCESRQPAMEAR